METRQSVEQRAVHTDLHEDKMLEAFVQKPEKILWYKHAFSKFNINGIDKMGWVWSWWAFFGSFWFLLYRKAYLAALGLFVISLVSVFIPFLGLVVWVLTGGFSTYFIYKSYKNKKNEIENSIENPDKQIETMKAVGGYNQWVVWLGVALLILQVVGILAAVIIPKIASAQ